MNWKILVGLIIGIAIVSMGFFALHGNINKSVGATVLDDNSGQTEGPHPPSADPWQIITPAPLDGPHPPSADPWNQ